MAVNKKAIGLLFEVAGGGNIEGETGKRINGQLRNLVGAINKSDTIKLKFTLDSAHLKKRVDEVKKQINEMNTASIDSGKGGGSSSITKKHTEAWTKATAAVKTYYQLITQTRKTMASTKDISETDGVFSTRNQRWEALVSQTNQAKVAMDSLNNEAARMNMTLEEREALTERIASEDAKLAIVEGSSQRSDVWKKASTYLDEYYRLQTLVQQAMTRTTTITKNADGTFATSEPRWATLVQQVNNASTNFETFATKENLAKMSTEELANFLTRLSSAQKRLDIDTATFEANGKQAWDNLAAKVSDYLSRVEYAASRDDNAVQMMKDLKDLANSGNWQGYDELKKKLAEVQQYINANGLATETWYQKMTKTFGTRVRSMISGLALAKITQALKEMLNVVVDIDSAMTQLKIVTGATETQMTEFLSNSIDLAKELGSSVSDVLSAVETFSRLGYDIDDSTILAKYATVLSKVADVTEDEATTGLTSILKGYQLDSADAEHIADVLIEVGQKYAVSASELMEAYEKAGSALSATETSFEKSAGLIAAANASVQDASVVGTALKTVSARIRKSTTDLDELGESADDLVESWSIYADEIEALTGFNIMVEGSTTQFKDLYDIFAGLAEVWDDLGEDADTTQARVAEILGGTRQYQVISSILTNWGDAANAYADAMESSGVATNSMETYMDSIEGKWGALKASFEEFSENLLDSDLIKFCVEVLNFITKTLNGITKLINKIGGLNTVLTITASILATIKGEAILTTIATGISKLTSSLSLVTWVLKEARIEGSSFSTVIGTLFPKLSSGLGSTAGAVGISIAMLGTAYTIITKIQQARAEAVQEYLTAASAAEDEAKEVADEAKTLEDLIAQYKKLADEKNGDTWDNDALTQVESIQDQIVDLIGEQASGIDLVNQGLEEQLDLLNGIVKQNYNSAYDAAVVAKTNAENAIFKATSAPANYDVPGTAIIEEAKKYGVSVSEGSTNLLGTSIKATNIQSQFDTVEEFVEQYEAVVRYQTALAKEGRGNESVYKYLTEYISDFEDVYNTYISAQQAYNYVTEQQTAANEQEEAAAKGAYASLKSLNDILEETQDGFEGISDALDSLTDEGYLTTDALSKLASLEEDGALAGLKLSDILIEDANGFKLAEDALVQYVNALVASYVAEKEYATEDSKNNAIANLENLRRVLLALANSQEATTDATEKQQEALEKQQETLQEQLDSYQKLIDLRKKLLEQYEEEISYKKELAEKEKSVSKLQAQLAVSQLDTSAAGRAKTRELQEELSEAQNELDEFNLDHAIEVVTNELDSQYEEYETYINNEVDSIEDKITSLTNKTSDSITDSAKTISNAIESASTAITEAIKKIKSQGVSENNSESSDDDTGVWVNYQDAVEAGYSGILNPHEFARGGKDETTYGTYKEYLAAMYKKYVGVYHSGGIVGDAANAKSTEVFAKLLQGEFVATPKMMHDFINTTLPDMTSSTSTNEFNAPLVSIQCDNVTQESLPQLESIVKEAVNQIKRQFESGLTRAGYHKTANQIA